MRLNRILALKTNVIGTIAIALVSSVATVFAADWLEQRSNKNLGTLQGASPSARIAPLGTALTDCEAGIYSPVQKACVDQATFDAEMQRLFLALGLDPSIYASESAGSGSGQ